MKELYADFTEFVNDAQRFFETMGWDEKTEQVTLAAKVTIRPGKTPVIRLPEVDDHRVNIAHSKIQEDLYFSLLDEYGARGIEFERECSVSNRARVDGLKISLFIPWSFREESNCRTLRVCGGNANEKLASIQNARAELDKMAQEAQSEIVEACEAYLNPANTDNAPAWYEPDDEPRT